MKSDMDYNSLVMNISLEHLDAATNDSNSSTHPCNIRKDETYFLLYMIVSELVTLSICCMGLLGNGTVIWLLVFQIKRNPFTIFILNLAVADFGFLISIALLYINEHINFLEHMVSYLIIASLFLTTYLSSQFLLTAISIDRCVCVLFPIWHRLSRPNRLSAAVCAVLWIISFLLGGVVKTMGIVIDIEQFATYDLLFFMTAMMCCPVITISVVVLSIKLSLKSQQQNRGRLLLMIFITLLCFLILAWPLSIYALVVHFEETTCYFKREIWEKCLVVCSCLNSSVNPFIYFLIGRKKRGQSRRNLKVILQKAFKEAE